MVLFRGNCRSESRRLRTFKQAAAKPTANLAGFGARRVFEHDLAFAHATSTPRTGAAVYASTAAHAASPAVGGVCLESRTQTGAVCPPRVALALAVQARRTRTAGVIAAATVLIRAEFDARTPAVDAALIAHAGAGLAVPEPGAVLRAVGISVPVSIGIRVGARVGVRIAVPVAVHGGIRGVVHAHCALGIAGAK
jgi:hypothetical protein